MCRLASRSGIILGTTALHLPMRTYSEPQADSTHNIAKTHASIVVATHNANSPTEDRHLVHQQTGWNVCAVFDGHGGWQVADYASKSFIGHLIPRLIHSRPDMHNEVTNAIERTFESVEEGYITAVSPAYKLGFGEVGKVGSCALLAVQKGHDLFLGNCGDCRAVLCSSVSTDSNNSSTRAVATRLTRDHNARTPIEALLLRQAHPNEPDIVICKNPHACYVKGRLQLTRALGDLYLKHDAFNAAPNSHRSSGRRIPDPYTPPYLSAVPEIYHFQLDTNDKFIILATDGLWDFLSDQEAVEVVQRSLKDHAGDTGFAASSLVEAALSRAAEANHMSVEELKNLPEGSGRRKRYDDTTAVVMFL